MEAIDITERLTDFVLRYCDDVTIAPADTSESFFIDAETGERFLVLVAKVSE